MSLARIFLFIQDVYFYGLGVGDLGGFGVAEAEDAVSGEGQAADLTGYGAGVVLICPGSVIYLLNYPLTLRHGDPLA